MSADEYYLGVAAICWTIHATANGSTEADKWLWLFAVLALAVKVVIHG